MSMLETNFLSLLLRPGELEVGSAPYVEQDERRGTLKIRGVQEADAGQYNCVASSSAGTFTGTVSLEVGGKTRLRCSAQSGFFSQTQRKLHPVLLTQTQRPRCFWRSRLTRRPAWGRTSPSAASPEVYHRQL